MLGTPGKAKAVESALATLGFGPAGYKIGSVVFAQAGGNMFGPNQPVVTVYEATQSVYVFFEGDDLNDMGQLTKKSAEVLEALRKAGAVPGNSPGAGRMMVMPEMQGGLIIYTIKDASAHERKALQMAIAQARQSAQDIAAGLNVQITGVRNVQSLFISGVDGGRGQLSLEGLPYRYYSSKSGEVGVTERATVEFDYK